jgi:hypothetical protein
MREVDETHGFVRVNEKRMLDIVLECQLRTVLEAEQSDAYSPILSEPEVRLRAYTFVHLVQDPKF